MDKQTDKPKSKWTNVSLPLGNIEVAQERRSAYDSAAKDAGLKFSEWARKVLDKAAGFKLLVPKVKS